ncbi:histone deacetylase 6 isoform X2 [Rhynchophorus ferrugineus]|uniref:Histone deacetylase domain-containing protein n=1 Tax=Rhynchophorus ferrugineus TaxID=354439 RepID=A0A834HWQ7_RHYFE|nr:hypothetical protein GWI33_017436 [Rhynchophorus ferrugineus]
MERKEEQIEKMTKMGAVPKRNLRQFIKEKREAKASKTEPDKIQGTALEDPYKPTYDFQMVFKKSTAYGYIPSMEHFSPWDPNFPENSVRAVAIHDAIQPIIGRLDIIDESHFIDIDDDELLSLAHHRYGIELVRRLCANANENEAQMYDSIYYNGEESFECAVNAAKMAVTMSKFIAEGVFQNGFANIRPPGHHALPDNPNGYCLFNNVAIAANYLLKYNLAEKILIVDYDVHHGQGTQHMFYESDRVLYFSIHRYEHGTFWPNLKESNFDCIGDNEGTGYNVNVPLNDVRLRDYDYLAIITNILLPLAYEYNPSIILVSAGYDGCMGCPEGNMYVTPAFYGHVITALSGVAGGKICVILEGGYCITSLADAGLRTVRALLGDPPHPLEYTTHINPAVISTINDVKFVLRPYWKCFQLDPLLPIDNIHAFDRYNQHLVVKRYIGVRERPPFPTKGYYSCLNFSQQKLVDACIRYFKEDRYNLNETVIGYMVNEESPLHQPIVTCPTQEVQGRLDDILKKFRDFDLLDRMCHFELPLKNNRPTIWYEVEGHILQVHDSSYLLDIDYDNLPKKPDIYVCLSSRDVCRYSICTICYLAQKINLNEITHGIAIIRPPGHHAKEGEAGGFCLINNVVVATSFIAKNCHYKKILIVDFDVHHGDGTQELTYKSKNVMYISMHRYDDGKYFPKDKTGNYTYIGSGPGYGYNINIPFNNDKMGNSDYLFTWMKLVLPLSYSYNPELIIVSAGFDAGINDPLGNYKVSPETFGHMVNMLKPVAPMILALEGGYNFETTSLSMVNCARALLGHPLPMPVLEDVSEETKKTIQNVLSRAKPLWGILEVNKSCDPTMRDISDLEDIVKSIDDMTV